MVFPWSGQSRCETGIIDTMMEPSSSFASLMQLGSDAQMSGSDYVGTSFEHYRLLAEINGERASSTLFDVSGRPNDLEKGKVLWDYWE